MKNAHGFLHTRAALAASLTLWLTMLMTPLSAQAQLGDNYCGDIGQRPCGTQDCKIKVGWALIAYPYEYCPPACHAGLTVVGNECSPPQGHCGISCKMAAIQAHLGPPANLTPGNTMYCFGTPFDPYNGVKVSRADLNLASGDKSVIVDIGGEGRHQDDEHRQWGSSTAINLNCSLNRTTFGDTVEPIPNLVFGFADNMPFANAFADMIIINNAPIVVSEIERVIRPGGSIKISYVSESKQAVELLLRHMCVSPAVTLSGFYHFIQIDVPANFNHLQPRNCPPREDL